jgi:hypothetical protein
LYPFQVSVKIDNKWRESMRQNGTQAKNNGTPQRNAQIPDPQTIGKASYSPQNAKNICDGKYAPIGMGDDFSETGDMSDRQPAAER